MIPKEKVKEICIKQLEELIQSIKKDEISDNYIFSIDVLECEQDYKYKSSVVRYSVTRNEYTKI